MKIGLVLDDTLDKPDGVQAAMLAIGKRFTSLGHEVHYLVTNTERRDLENIHSLTSYYSLRFNGNTVRTPKPASKKAIRILLDELQLDVIHVQMPYSPLMAGRIVSIAPKTTKIFGTFHILPYNSLAKIGTGVLGLLLQYNLRRFDGFFAVSAPAASFMKKTFRVSGSVLPNPIDYAFYSSFTHKVFKKTQIVFVGRFDVRKGVKQLVSAVAELPLDVQNTIEVTMCGKGPLLDELSITVKDKKLPISFPGFVSETEKAQYLANADIAVFPSTSGESFGIVLAEAMAAGAGITLGGDNPGYRSVLQDYPECLFNPNNIDDFSAVLLHYINNPQDRKHIGSEQHEFVKKFDIVAVADQLIKEYKK